MDKRLFAYLKDRKVFTSGGHKTLREYLTARETRTEKKDRARKVIKKPTVK
jgi:hypothetical protein